MVFRSVCTTFAPENRMKMIQYRFFLVLLAAILMVGCGSEKEQKETSVDSTQIQPEGDMTVYGMVCDGCNDTIVIYLPVSYSGMYDGSNPDTVDILDAMRNHQVFGKPHIGDKLAMLLNPNDSSKADIVVVTDQLMGSWCYKVLPTLRQTADMEGQTEKESLEQLPDSIQELLTIEREYGLNIKSNHTVFPIGAYRQATTIDEEMPVEYPVAKRYREWRLYNGKLVLLEAFTDSLGQLKTIGSDTAEFVHLTTDTLVLRLDNEEKGFYRKVEAEQ